VCLAHAIYDETDPPSESSLWVAINAERAAALRDAEERRRTVESRWMMGISTQFEAVPLSEAGQSRWSAEVTLFKYQALGNSYLIFDPLINPNALRSMDSATRWIRMVCSHDYGIGSNGLLIGPNVAKGGMFEFRIFNSDGTQAQLSGNGSRIFARYLLDAGYANPMHKTRFSVVAVSPMSRVVVDVEPPLPDDARIVTDINIVPTYGPSAVEARPGSIQGSGLHFTVAALADIGRRYRMADKWGDSSLISIGNPHCVTFVDRPDLLPSIDLLKQLRAEFSLIADASSHYRGTVFRQGCNLQWCFIESRECVHLRIVERGEGPTLASGSSASAAAIAAYARGLIDESATIVMPGGDLRATLLFEEDEVNRIRIAGTAARVAEIWTDAPS
jgi:diaminopimelate epimerase